MRSHSSKPGPRAGIFKIYVASGVALTILFYTTFALGMGVVKRSYWQWRELAIAAGEESGFGRYIGDCLTFRVDRHQRPAALVEQSLPVEAASQEPAPAVTTPSVTPTPSPVPASASRRRTEQPDASEQPAGTVLVGSATQPSATPSEEEAAVATESAAESEPEPPETTAGSATVNEPPTVESAPAPHEEKKRKFWQKVGGIFKGKKKPAGEPAR